MCLQPQASCHFPHIQCRNTGLAVVQPWGMKMMGTRACNRRLRLSSASNTLHNGQISLTTGFLPSLSLLVFFLGMCVMGCHRAERPRVMSPWSESPSGTARNVQASQGTRTSCPTVFTHPGGRAVVGASIPMRQPLLGVLGSHTPYLGMGRSEARQAF